ncbi:hypothetical protein D3C75_1133560 [compost metagenome]
MPQKYFPSLSHIIGSLIKCSFIKIILTIPSSTESEVATMPAAITQDKKCGKYDID